MARSVAALISANVRYPNGEPVECVIADTCIGGAAESAMAADKFAREGATVSLTVTPCWCYGSETMDMDPLAPKAVWGFNGTERPGAVYLAAVLAAHNQKGLPAFGIYGRDVQDAGRHIDPGRREGKTPQVRPGRPCGGDHARQDLPLDGRRIDGDRRVHRRPVLLRKLPWDAGRQPSISPNSPAAWTSGIYDGGEYKRAFEWVRANCRGGTGHQPAESPPQPGAPRLWNGRPR